jgi:hypothetical protein
MATPQASNKNQGTGGNGHKHDPNALAVVGGGALPAFLDDKVEADAGRGISTDQADNLVPLIYLLQTNSPQVNQRNEKYVDGAAPGDIWLRNSDTPIIRGDEGIVFQPCHFQVSYNEWVPREDNGGFVGVHLSVPPNAKCGEDPTKPGKVYWEMPNGNEIIETRTYRGFVILPDGRALPYSLPFSGTGHTAAKTMMFLSNQQRTTKGTKPALWSCFYRLKTQLRKNKLGEFFNFTVANAGVNGKTAWVQTAEEYERGRALYEAFESGAKKDEAPAHNDADAAMDDAGGKV